MTSEKQQCLLGYLNYYTLRRRDGTLAVDNIPGPALREAVRSFQEDHGLSPDGIWGPLTEAAVLREIREGKPPEDVPPAQETPDSPAGDYPWLVEWQRRIRCQCGGRYCSGLPSQGFSDETLEMANEVGRRAGVRLVCTSGYRCPHHNAETPGASPTSCHMSAIAFDGAAENGAVSPQRLFDIADEVVGDRGGVGVYPWGIHLDSRGYRARWDSR